MKIMDVAALAAALLAGPAQAILQVDLPASQFPVGTGSGAIHGTMKLLGHPTAFEGSGTFGPNGFPAMFHLVFDQDEAIVGGVVEWVEFTHVCEVDLVATTQRWTPAPFTVFYQQGPAFPVSPVDDPAFQFQTLECNLPPQCDLSPAYLDFGSTGPGEAVTGHLTLTNLGGGLLEGVAAASCGPFQVLEPAFSLGPGEQRDLAILFQSDTPGRHMCVLEVGGGCGAVTLDGQVVVPPICTVSATQLDFGTTQMGLPVTRTFTLANGGLEPLVGEVLPGCDAFQVANGIYNLAPGEEQLVAVTLLADEPGVFLCGLDAGGLCPDVALVGTVTQAPACQLSTTAIDFGVVSAGVQASRTFTITNVGAGILSGTVGESCPRFGVINGTYSLDAGESQTVTVTFLSSEPGSHSCALQVGSCGELPATAQVELVPYCHVNTSLLDFGPLQPGVPVSRNFLITNMGGGTLTGMVAPSCGDFVVSNGSYSLAAQESQLVTVTLLTEDSGFLTCQLDVGSTCGSIELRAGSADHLGEVWSECFCLPFDPQNPNYFEFPAVGDPSVLTPYHTLRMTGTSGHDSYLQTPGRFFLDGMTLDVVVSLSLSECAEALGIHFTPQALTAVPASPILPAGLSIVLDRLAMGCLVSVYDDGLQVATAMAPVLDSDFHTLRLRYDSWMQAVRLDLFQFQHEEEVLNWTEVNGPPNGYLGFSGFGAQGCYQYLDDVCAWLRDEMGYEIGVPEEGPLDFALEPAAPNPFNPTTTLSFTLAETGPVRLKVFNLAGQQVAVLVDGLRERGRHEVVFDASALASGVYFATLEAEGFCVTRPLTLLK